MHEKTSVPALIEELYTFLRQADARELGMIFREIDAARAAGDSAKERELLDKAENYETHVVPIIADIDAGFGNAEATRSEEHTSELQSLMRISYAVFCLKKKKKTLKKTQKTHHTK